MTTEREIRETVVTQVNDVLDLVYGFITPGTPVEYKTTILQEALQAKHPGLTLNLADSRCSELMSLGILTRTIHYGRHLPDGTWAVGRYAMWDLHMTKDEAKAAVEEWSKKYLAGEVDAARYEREKARAKSGEPKPRKARNKDMTNYHNQPAVAPGGPIERVVAVAADPAEDTRAIAGPDKPNPMESLRSARKTDDAGALIAAARQYANRGDKMADHIKALKETAKSLGIEIDDQVLAAGIKLDRDERLETVSLILPYIDSLEARVERMVRQLAEVKDKVRDAEQLANDNRRLRGRVEALVSQQVQRQQAQA